MKLEVRSPSLDPWTLVVRAGRLLLLSALVFWWGGIVLPRLIELSSSSLLPIQEYPRTLAPEVDGSLANAISALALASLSILALGSAVLSSRRVAGRIAVGGWLVMSLTAGLLAWDELSDFHVAGLGDLAQSVFGSDLIDDLGHFIWVPLLSPLIAGFLGAMTMFVWRGMNSRETRFWFVVGLAAWILVLALELSTPILLLRVAQSEFLGSLLEETLEFSGTLALSLGAATVWRRHEAGLEHTAFGGPRRRVLLGWGVAMAVAVGVFALWVIRVPLVEARSPTTHIDTFVVTLRGQDAAVQEIRMPKAPVSRVGLRLAAWGQGDQQGRAGVRFMRPDAFAAELSGGARSVPRRHGTEWLSIDLVPPLAEPEGQRLAMWVVADMGPGAELSVGASKSNPYPEGGLWINGEPAWPDQDLEFVLYSAGEPTLSKARAFWTALTSDWRRLLATAELAIALIAVLMSPALVVAAALPERRPAS